MQQTENYKLNLIETTDTFSPAPLNENAEKTEAALTAETAARTAGDAALDARLTVLELKKIAIGSYAGNSQDGRFIDLGFTPRAVWIRDAPHDDYDLLLVNDMTYYSNKIVEGGFEVCASAHPSYNQSYSTYFYIAFA